MLVGPPCGRLRQLRRVRVAQRMLRSQQQKYTKVVGFSQTTLLIFDWLLTWWQNMQMSCLLIDRYVADLAVICLPFDQLFWGNKNGRHTQSLIGK